MKKHIKVHAKLINKNSEVLLTLLECSHLGSEFGSLAPEHVWRLSPHYGTFLTNKVRMYSTNKPYAHGMGFLEYDKPFGSEGADFSVRFGIVTSSISIPIKYWPRVKAAIEAYNAWGETQ